MRVLLLKDIKGLGHAGDIKEVAGGYATNYLIPNRLAQPYVEGMEKAVQQAKEAAARKQERKSAEAQMLAARLHGQTVVLKARAGEGERLYGSITAADIAEALAQTIGLQVDRKLIQLEHPIKTLGEHPVQVKLGSGLAATVTVIVERSMEAA